MVAQDGRDKARRQGITQQQRAVVTYSFSWISAVVAQMPAQLYFREHTPTLATSKRESCMMDIHCLTLTVTARAYCNSKV